GPGRGGTSADDDGAGLGALGADLLDVADRAAGAEVVERPAQDAVLVEVDLAAVAGLEEAVAVAAVHPAHPAQRVTVAAPLDLAPARAGVVHELAPRRAEGVAQGDRELLVSRAALGVAADHELGAGHGDVD